MCQFCTGKHELADIVAASAQKGADAKHLTKVIDKWFTKEESDKETDPELAQAWEDQYRKLEK